MTTVTITVSEKQVELLKLLEKGHNQKEVSTKLNVSPSQLKLMIYALCQQWNCKNSVQLVCYAIRNSII
jgi:DNA-binding NarL/FixJ family response regulator